MASDLPIRCGCGLVRGVARGVSGKRGNRVVCYCADCQIYAHFLGRAGELLDEHGGSDIFQMVPVDLSIDAGIDQLACVRLTPKGVLRWYSLCCKTPIANSLPTGKVPFAGLLRIAFGREAEEALGPVRERVFGCFARGDTSGIEAHERTSAWMLIRFAARMFAANLRGENRPLPFFDPSTGEPRIKPRGLDAEAWRQLDSVRLEASGPGR